MVTRKVLVPAGVKAKFRKHYYVKGGKDECWEWQGAANVHGYGVFTTYPHDNFRSFPKKKSWQAHRLALLIATGEPLTQHVLHSCDNRRCVNPAHLRQGSISDNARDMHARGRDNWSTGKLKRGSAHPQTKITEDDVREIRRRYAAGGITQRELGEEYGMSQPKIGKIILRRSWTHVPDENQ